MSVDRPMTIEDVPETLIITMNDIKAASYCSSGARRWFADYGLNFPNFISNGILARTLFQTDDALAVRVVTLKMQKESTRG